MFKDFFIYEFEDGFEGGIGSFLLEGEEQEYLHVGGKVFPFDTKQCDDKVVKI